MISTREKFEPWLRDYLRKRYPELEPAMVAALEAFDRIQAEQRIDEDLLEPLVAAATSSRRPLYETATSLLGNLTGLHEAARQAVMRMAADPKAHVRFNAILCTGKTTPIAFTIQLIRQGLNDRSANVRGKAADWALTLRIHDVVPDLEKAAATEKDAKAKATIDFGLKLLRDGYILTPSANEGVYITTLCRDGITSRYVRGTELENHGLPALVAELSAR